MELDEIKLLMKARLEQGVTNSVQELEAAVRKRTQSVTGKIKRNIRLESVAFVCCGLGAVYCWLTYPSLLVHVFCIATWTLCTVFGMYLYALHRKIVFYETVPGTVKENLVQIIQIIKRFTTLYFGISMGLLPVIYVFGLIIGYLVISKQGLLQQFNWSKTMLYYGLAFIMGWSVIIYFLSKWYIRKLYGKYLLQLQQQLKDIENG